MVCDVFKCCKNVVKSLYVNIYFELTFFQYFLSHAHCSRSQSTVKGDAGDDEIHGTLSKSDVVLTFQLEVNRLTSFIN